MVSLAGGLGMEAGLREREVAWKKSYVACLVLLLAAFPPCQRACCPCAASKVVRRSNMQPWFRASVTAVGVGVAFTLPVLLSGPLA